jgi:hypothetical protein
VLAFGPLGRQQINPAGGSLPLEFVGAQSKRSGSSASPAMSMLSATSRRAGTGGSTVALSRCRTIGVERAMAPQVVPSLPVQEQIAYWLGQAADARSRADGFKSDEARRSMLEVAHAYEHMARQLEQLLPGAVAA